MGRNCHRYSHCCRTFLRSYFDPENQLGRLADVSDACRFSSAGRDFHSLCTAKAHADMLLKKLLFIGCSVFSTLQASIGGDRHVYYLSEQVVIDALKWNFILRGLDILAYATGKAAIGALILRLLERQSVWQKWVVWIVITITAIINILNCIFNFVQCIPVHANWTPGIPAKCWNPKVQIDFAYFMSSTLNHSMVELENEVLTCYARRKRSSRHYSGASPSNLSLRIEHGSQKTDKLIHTLRSWSHVSHTTRPTLIVQNQTEKNAKVFCLDYRTGQLYAES